MQSPLAECSGKVLRWLMFAAPAAGCCANRWVLAWVAAGFADVETDHARAEVLLRECLALYRQLGDARGIASTLQGLGWLALRNNYEAACSLYEESLALYREVGDDEAVTWLLLNVAHAVSAKGDYRRGYALYEESLVMFR